MPSGHTIRLSLPNTVLFFLMPLGLFGGSAQWVMPPSFIITLIPYVLLKPWIQDLSQQSSGAFFLLSFPLVAADSKCPRATSMQPTSLIEKLNRH